MSSQFKPLSLTQSVLLQAIFRIHNVAMRSCHSNHKPTQASVISQKSRKKEELYLLLYSPHGFSGGFIQSKYSWVNMVLLTHRLPGWEPPQDEQGWQEAMRLETIKHQADLVPGAEQAAAQLTSTWGDSTQGIPHISCEHLRPFCGVLGGSPSGFLEHHHYQSGIAATHSPATGWILRQASAPRLKCLASFGSEAQGLRLVGHSSMFGVQALDCISLIKEIYGQEDKPYLNHLPSLYIFLIIKSAVGISYYISYLFYSPTQQFGKN